jgi:hypothetical protein
MKRRRDGATKTKTRKVKRAMKEEGKKQEKTNGRE